MAIQHPLFRKHPSVPQAIIVQRKNSAAVFNSHKYASSCYDFYPRNKSKTRAPVEGFP